MTGAACGIGAIFGEQTSSLWSDAGLGSGEADRKETTTTVSGSDDVFSLISTEGGCTCVTCRGLQPFVAALLAPDPIAARRYGRPRSEEALERHLQKCNTAPLLPQQQYYLIAPTKPCGTRSIVVPSAMLVTMDMVDGRQ